MILIGFEMSKTYNKSFNKQHRMVREDDMFRQKVVESKKYKKPKNKQKVEDFYTEYETELKQ